MKVVIEDEIGTQEEYYGVKHVERFKDHRKDDIALVYYSSVDGTEDRVEGEIIAVRDPLEKQ
jgi:hypothetical protein